MTRNEVKVGQQYHRVGGTPSVWQVATTFGDPSGIVHARLFNVERPSELKTLTCSVLRDSRSYRLLAERPAAAIMDAAAPRDPA